MFPFGNVGEVEELEELLRRALCGTGRGSRALAVRGIGISCGARSAKSHCDEESQRGRVKMPRAVCSNRMVLLSGRHAQRRPSEPKRLVAATRSTETTGAPPREHGLSNDSITARGQSLRPATWTRRARMELPGCFQGGRAGRVRRVPARRVRRSRLRLRRNILVDSPLPGAGACATRRLALTFARYVRVYHYEFHDRSAPVPSWLTTAPGYELGEPRHRRDVRVRSVLRQRYAEPDSATEALADLPALLKFLSRPHLQRVGAHFQEP